MSLRILHITPYYEAAWGYGGIPRVATSLSLALVGRGHRVSVWTTDACDELSRLRNGGTRFRSWRGQGEGGVSLRVFPNLSNRLAYRRQAFLPLGLRSALREGLEEYDLVHIHGHHHLLSSMVTAELSRRRRPYLLAPNGIAGRSEGQRVAKWVFDATLGRGVLKQARRVLAVSRAETQQLHRLGVPLERIRQVPNPIDVEDFAPETEAGSAPARPFGGKADRLVLYLGTLIPRKCVDVLLRALPLLRGAGRVGLLIAGNDLGAGRRLRRLVRRLGIGAQVQFLGLLRGRERYHTLSQVDVVAYPGRQEYFGLVPFEAILSGTPVVVANDSGCGEILSGVGGGLVVPPGKERPLAAALSEILNAPEKWQRSVREAQARVRGTFASDVVAAQLERVYAEVLSESLS